MTFKYSSQALFLSVKFVLTTYILKHSSHWRCWSQEIINIVLRKGKYIIQLGERYDSWVTVQLSTGVLFSQYALHLQSLEAERKASHPILLWYHSLFMENYFDKFSTICLFYTLIKTLSDDYTFDWVKHNKDSIFLNVEWYLFLKGTI